MFFCLISFNIIPSRLIYAEMTVFRYFLWLIFHCICICKVFSLHSSVNEHLVCFCILAIVNTTVLECTYFFQLVFLDKYPRVELLDKAVLFSIFLEKPHTIIHNVCAQLISHVWLFVTPMDYSLTGSSVHGIFQIRSLEQVVISYPGSSWHRD